MLNPAYHAPYATPDNDGSTAEATAEAATTGATVRRRAMREHFLL